MTEAENKFTEYYVNKPSDVLNQIKDEILSVNVSEALPATLDVMKNSVLNRAYTEKNIDIPSMLKEEQDKIRNTSFTPIRCVPKAPQRTALSECIKYCINEGAKRVMNFKRWLKSVPYSQRIAPYVFISPFIIIFLLFSFIRQYPRS